MTSKADFVLSKTEQGVEPRMVDATVTMEDANLPDRQWWEVVGLNDSMSFEIHVDFNVSSESYNIGQVLGSIPGVINHRTGNKYSWTFTRGRMFPERELVDRIAHALTPFRRKAYPDQYPKESGAPELSPSGVRIEYVDREVIKEVERELDLEDDYVRNFIEIHMKNWMIRRLLMKRFRKWCRKLWLKIVYPFVALWEAIV